MLLESEKFYRDENISECFVKNNFRNISEERRCNIVFIK